MGLFTCRKISKFSIRILDNYDSVFRILYCNLLDAYMLHDEYV